MIKQQVIYNKKTYLIKEFIETTNDMISHHIKYDKLERKIYELKGNEEYEWKYHKDTTKFTLYKYPNGWIKNIYRNGCRIKQLHSDGAYLTFSRDGKQIIKHIAKNGKNIDYLIPRY